MTVRRINLLDKITIDKIAAGEAVERPCNVVKEMVENSIDAGASSVTCEIKNGGISYIRVTDNGAGIEPDDVKKAFMRHATSKIKDETDLERISSLGFRGEALASISSVAKVELISKTEDSLMAVRYVIEGGEEISFEEIGAPDGTTVIVRDLFFNTPARSKFLKTPMTEGSRIGSYMEMLALSRPEIAFTFITNGNVRLSTAGNGRLKDVIYEIFGRSIVPELIEISGEDQGISVSGYIAKPSVHRKNRNFENYFVNGRYVKSKVIAGAIEEGYRQKLMQHDYPFTCLMINIPPELMDVNVHPAKMEVRFYDEKALYDLISQTIRKVLSGAEMIVDAADRKEKKTEPVKEHLEPFEKRRLPLPENAYPKQADTAPEAEASASAGTETAASPAERESVYHVPGYEKINEGIKENENYRFLSKEAAAKRRIIGQVFDTYWLCEFDGKLMIIDQHAAHEKVLYERLMKEYESSRIMSQALSPGIVFTFESRELEKVTTYADAFRELGFEIERFGDREYILNAVPYNLSIADPEELFYDILESVGKDKNVRDLPEYVRRIATEACKAAVKGGGRISYAEAQKLIDDLMELEDPYHCPHGRPTIISFGKQEIEKKFGRIV